jgi:hypothetical protein
MDEDQRTEKCNFIDDNLAELPDECIEWLAGIVGQMKTNNTMFYNLPEVSVANLMMFTTMWNVNLRNYNGAVTQLETLIDYLKNGNKAEIAERMLQEMSR